MFGLTLRRGLGAANTAETDNSDPTGSPYSIKTRAHMYTRTRTHTHTYTHMREHFRVNAPTTVVHSWAISNLYRHRYHNNIVII